MDPLFWPGRELVNRAPPNAPWRSVKTRDGTRPLHGRESGTHAQVSFLSSPVRRQTTLLVNPRGWCRLAGVQPLIGQSLRFAEQDQALCIRIRLFILVLGSDPNSIECHSNWLLLSPTVYCSACCRSLSFRADPKTQCKRANLGTVWPTKSIAPDIASAVSFLLASTVFGTVIRQLP